MAGGDKIVIRGIKVFAYHGVLAEERERGQDFFIDVELFLDLHSAGMTDDLSKTVDYAGVCSKVRAAAEALPACFLIESLAEKIAKTLLAEFPLLASVLVRVHKPQAPVGVPVEDLFVEISRSRHLSFNL